MAWSKITGTRGMASSLFPALVFLHGIVSFALFRVILLSLHQKDIHYTGWKRHLLVAEAFWTGFRFDTVISCYILSGPVVILGLLSVTGLLRVWSLRLGYCLVAVLYVLSFALCAADIPFYEHFLTRLNDTLLAWQSHSSFGIRMVAESPYIWVFSLLFLAVSVVFLLVLRWIYRCHARRIRNASQDTAWYSYLRFSPVLLFLSALLLLGMRGRIAAKTPILAGAAAISDDPVINALGLNPVFSFIRSTLDSRQPENQRLQWISDAAAVGHVSGVLHADPSLTGYSPIARKVSPAAPLAGRNVVLVIMESMSSAKMARFGNRKNLTPCLDSLAARSWSFDKVWSAGIHTYNGIYSTLFGHPALMKKHPMEVVDIPQISGLPAILSEQGYSTMFFTTHDELFDNMSGFLSANGMQKIYGEKDYPAREIRSTMGVPDEYMFRFAIPRLRAAGDQPFFAAFMTGSDHDPIVIPEGTGFVPRHTEKYEQSASYADWSIGRFMQYAEQEPWYNNTLFVFVADHGCAMGENTYDVVFSYQHIPLVIYAPGFTTPRVFPELALQTDVMATILGLVSKPYVSSTFSLDLLRERHDDIVFSSDERLVCMSDSLMFVYRTAGAPGLYRYTASDPHNYYEEDSATALPMRFRAFAWLQTSQWMLERRRCGKPAGVSLPKQLETPGPEL